MSENPKLFVENFCFFFFQAEDGIRDIGVIHFLQADRLMKILLCLWSDAGA